MRPWWRKNFLRGELYVSLALGAAFLIWCQYYGGFAIVDGLLKGNRGTIFGTLASMFGSLLGFVIATETLVLTISSVPRLAIVRNSKHYSTLWKVFFSAIWWLAGSTIIALIGLFIDRDTSPHKWILYSCATLIIISITRMARCIWALELVISTVTNPPEPPSSGRKDDSKG